MNQEVPPEDLLFGGVVLAVFLVCVFFAGKLLSRLKNARFAKAWVPLAPLIDGKVVDDGSSASTSWLTP